MEEETMSPAKINQIKTTDKKKRIKKQSIYKINLQNFQMKMRLKKCDSGSLNRHVEWNKDLGREAGAQQD